MMVPSDVARSLNEVRAGLVGVLNALDEIQSFQSLGAGVPEVRDGRRRVGEVLEHRLLKEPCTGALTVAIVGSSGHGKTTLLDEMLPGLSSRGWLVTDVTDTTAQALSIQRAAEDDGEKVEVSSLDLEGLKGLISHPEVREQHDEHGLEVRWQSETVEVDGTEATFPRKDREGFRFPPKTTLRPFGRTLELEDGQKNDPRFIRALTVKEPSTALRPEPVLSIDGRDYDALQLRALVREVRLRDDFRELERWCGHPLHGLRLVDTPGLATAGSAKDEVLRYVLERKAEHLLVEMFKRDELDLCLHLVLNGRQSDFARLWKALERECGAAAVRDLPDRMVLAVNGMNLYFTNRDIKARWEDERKAQEEGDHFQSTLEDNVLQKLSPSGRVRPARVVFLDSRSIVETLTTGPYEDAYTRYRPLMERWLEPGKPGYHSLKNLGLLEGFRDNLEALCDPEDRGQGALVRALTELAAEVGPGLLVRKHLVRTGLLQAIEDLDALLRSVYDQEGRLNREAVQDALRGCLAFLEEDAQGRELGPQGLEDFCASEVDPRLEGILDEVARGGRPEDAAARGFSLLGTELQDAILARAEASGEMREEFARHLQRRVESWRERWGYEAARLEPLEREIHGARALLGHCLKTHAREVLHQLRADEHEGEGAAPLSQTEEDRGHVQRLMQAVQRLKDRARELCREHGVTTDGSLEARS